jgi:hypothetical protein
MEKEAPVIPLLSLWIPIVVSAAIVFVVSSLIHMVLGYHKSDYARLPDEDKVMEALRKFRISPGDYIFPCPGSMKEMGSPEFAEKRSRGPVAFLTIMKSGPPSMGKNLAAWFLYSVVVGFVAAYITSRALGPGAPYLSVFRFAGCTAFVGYSLALWQNTIWYSRNWKTTLKSNFDGLIYALLTAGIFGWLWPTH